MNEFYKMVLNVLIWFALHACFYGTSWLTVVICTNEQRTLLLGPPAHCRLLHWFTHAGICCWDWSMLINICVAGYWQWGLGVLGTSPLDLDLGSTVSQVSSRHFLWRFLTGSEICGDDLVMPSICWISCFVVLFFSVPHQFSLDHLP